MKYIGYNFIITLLFSLFVMLTSQTADANTRNARALPVDHRVRTMPYQQDAVYKWVGHYKYQSSIEFAEGEEIKTISMGDSTAWALNPSGSRLFLKPVDRNATTNMTLITNKRTYLFELHANETDDIDDPNMVFIMRFIYPDNNENISLGGKYLDGVPDIDENPSKYNMSYTISGSDEIAPLKIFDDGEFTYFQFRDKNAEVPAFYWVDSENGENIINYRTRGNYIVVERVTSKFTLRHGADIVCVFNEKRLKRAKPTTPTYNNN